MICEYNYNTTLPPSACMSLTSRTICQVVSVGGVESDTADVSLSVQSVDAMLTIVDPEFH